MMGGNGTMTLGDMAPYLIGAATVIVAVIVVILVRLYRRGS